MSGVDYIEVDQDIVQNTKDLAFNQFKDSVNINKILEIFGAHREEMEQDAVNFSLGFLISNAVGSQLDVIGDFLNLPRYGEDDETYRRRIKLNAYGANANISRDSIVEMITLIFGQSPELYFGLYQDYYFYVQAGCFDQDTVGSEIERFMPLVSRSQVIETEATPFGFEGDDEAGGFGSVEGLNNDLTIGRMSSLVYSTPVKSLESLLYLLNSNKTQALSLGVYDANLANISEFRHMRLPLAEIDSPQNFISMNGEQGLEEMRVLLDGTGVVGNLSTYEDKWYYEIVPTEVKDYGLGRINHQLYMGSVTDGISTDGNDILTVLIEVDNQNPSDVDLIIRVVKENFDGTRAIFEETFSGISNIEDKVVGVLVDKRTRRIKIFYDGVDQGFVVATSSDDPDYPTGSTISWKDNRTNQALFFMEGTKTSVSMNDPNDTLSLRWNYKADQMSEFAPVDVRDIFGILIKE